MNWVDIMDFEQLDYTYFIGKKDFISVLNRWTTECIEWTEVKDSREIKKSIQSSEVHFGN